MKTEIFLYLFIGLFVISCSSPNEKKSNSDPSAFETQQDSQTRKRESEYLDQIDYNLDFKMLQEIQRDQLNELLKNNKSSVTSNRNKCAPLKIKRGTIVKIGKFNVKKGFPLEMNGFELSVNGTDGIFRALIAFDIASKNICIAINGLPTPPDEETRKFILTLLKQQQVYLSLYLKFEAIVETAKSENQLMNALQNFKEDLVKVEIK